MNAQQKLTALTEFTGPLSTQAREAFKRTLSTRGETKGRVKKRVNWRKDPLAWAAWAGYKTGMGEHSEGITNTLLLMPDEHRGDVQRIWGEVADRTIQLRIIWRNYQ